MVSNFRQFDSRGYSKNQSVYQMILTDFKRVVISVIFECSVCSNVLFYIPRKLLKHCCELLAFSLNLTNIQKVMGTYGYYNSQVVFGADSRTYSSGDVIELTLNDADMALIKDTNQKDLTGTLIIASNVVSVFSGNQNTGE